MIEIEKLGARVGSFELRDVSFSVPEGGYGVVIGAAGSGKTTLLETIAGIVPLRAGRIRLRGTDIAALPPERRRIGFVYQHGFLFPHLTVERNIAYGAASSAAARQASERLGAGDLLERPVRGLSGGERQLVAIARAIAAEPRILLLDEPFSALDPRRRVIVRREVRALHRETGMTVLQVTHDFTEAGLLGDVAVLLDRGRVLQHGAPERIFREPASPYIAEFLGAENVLAGVVRTLADQLPDWLEGDPATLSKGHRALEFRSGELVLYTIGDAPDGKSHAVIRADEIILSHEPPAGSARNRFRGPVSEVAALGALARVTVDVGGIPLVAALTTRSAHEMGLAPGVEVWASFKAMAVHLC